MIEILDDTNPIVVDKYGNPIEPKKDKLLIVDADTLVFRICLGASEVSLVLPKEFYTEEAWEEIINDPTYSEEKGEITEVDIDTVMSMIDDKLEELKELTGCNKLELHFTGGNVNFRYFLFEKYKANRIGLKVPPMLSHIKRLVKDTYDNVYIHIAVEADDAVISRYNELYPNCVLAAIDKDVLLSVPGRHFNYYTKAAYTNSKGERVPEVVAHFIEVTKLEAIRNKYKQVLTGDATDNIHFKYGLGLKGMGSKTADKLLKDCVTKDECLEVVKKAYLEKQSKLFSSLNLKEDELKSIISKNLLLTARLVSMEQYDMKSNKLTLEKEEIWRV